jgi:hypothetical protein
MVKEIIVKEMETNEMRECIKKVLEEMEKERKSILQNLVDRDHPNLQMATEVFEIASLLQPICIKSLYMDNYLCTQITSVLIAILNGVNNGYILDEVERLFKVHSLMNTSTEEAPKNKSKLN